MGQAQATPNNFSSEYDTICYRHSAQVTADANEFTEDESGRFHNLVDPIESWKDPARWLHGPFYSYQINKCKREGTPCTPLQELIFDWINTYAASRPAGAPEFVCHTRRSTGNDRLHKQGEIITAWQKQVVAARPPGSNECYPAQPADSATKSMEGKCYEITVPANSTYLVVDEQTEVLFPAGCEFRVLKDETPGHDVEVELIQRGVSTPEPFWGRADPGQSIDEWWNGTIELLRKTYTHDFWEAANLELPDKTTVSLDTNAADDKLDKEHVRDNVRGATVVYRNPGSEFHDNSEYGSRANQLAANIDAQLITYPPDFDRIRLRKNAWKATGGLNIMTALNLDLDEQKEDCATDTFVDLCGL